MLPMSLNFPIVTNPPKWSWKTLGTMAFLHAGESKGYDKTKLQFASKFSIVQFDKKQNIDNMPNSTQEDRFIASARQVKKIDETIQVLMYINGLINFPKGRLYELTSSNLLLHDSKGEIVHLRGNTVFNVQLSDMRKIFVEDALYGMASGAFNGVFIDRANWASSDKCVHDWGADLCQGLTKGQRKLFTELTDSLGEGNITLAKDTGGTKMEDWEVANAAMTSDTFCSHYCHTCNDTTNPASTWTHPGDSQDCANSIATIANMSVRGQLSQSHAMGPFGGPFSEEARLFTMAAFLIGAGNLSFYSYANWANNSWTLDGTTWWPEYDYPIGEPTSPANMLLPGKRWKYARNFSSGTTVYVDIATRVVDIQWARRETKILI